MEPVKNKWPRSRFVLALSFICFVVMFLLTSGILSNDEYKDIPLAWLGGGLSLYVLASFVD